MSNLIPVSQRFTVLLADRSSGQMTSSLQSVSSAILLGTREQTLPAAASLLKDHIRH